MRLRRWRLCGGNQRLWAGHRRGLIRLVGFMDTAWRRTHGARDAGPEPAFIGCQSAGHGVRSGHAGQVAAETSSSSQFGSDDFSERLNVQISLAWRRLSPSDSSLSNETITRAIFAASTD